MKEKVSRKKKKEEKEAKRIERSKKKRKKQKEEKGNERKERKKDEKRYNIFDYNLISNEFHYFPIKWKSDQRTTFWKGE